MSCVFVQAWGGVEETEGGLRGADWTIDDRDTTESARLTLHHNQFIYTTFTSIYRLPLRDRKLIQVPECVKKIEVPLW